MIVLQSVAINYLIVIVAWLIIKRKNKACIIFITLDNHHILRVSIEKEETRHNEIIDNILKITSNNKNSNITARFPIYYIVS
jgi:hypothetical protein